VQSTGAHDVVGVYIASGLNGKLEPKGGTHEGGKEISKGELVV
jgi:hypothetical protein